MREYPKIQTVWKRDPETKHRTLLEGEWALPEFEYLQNTLWEFTEKVDGTNIRVMLKEDGQVHFGGKTDRAQLPTNLLLYLQERFTAEDMSDLSGPLCLYGEGYGAGIQKGGKYRPDQAFVLFDVRVGEWWLKREDVVAISDQLKVEVVPVVGLGDLHELISWVQRRPQSTWGQFEAEGVVARPMVDLRARNGQRIITKLKCKDFPA
jgi:hypothetical protein